MFQTLPSDLVKRVQALIVQANMTHDAIGKEIVMHEIARLEADGLCKLEAEADKLLGIFLKALRMLATSL